MFSLAKKFVICLICVFSCSWLAFSQGFEVSASNELGSDLVYITDGDNKFAGIYDEIIIDVTSERVDAGLDVIAWYDNNGGKDGDSGRLFYSKEDFDWYAVLRPINDLNIGFSADNWLTGSYMFVEDDNVSGQKMGSDGLSFLYTGLPNLCIGVTAPFDLDENNNFDEFKFGFGAEYILSEAIVLGAAINDVSHDERIISFSAGFFPISGLEVYAGYSYQDFEGLCDVWGTHLLNASLIYSFDRFAVGADFLTNFGTGDDDDTAKSKSGVSEYDFYGALYGEYRIVDPILIYLTLADTAVFNRVGDGRFVVNPGVEYDTGRIGAFSVEVKLEYVEGKFSKVCFPVAWVYEF